MADGVFDIDENEFVRKPTEDTFDPEKYEADFQKKVSLIYLDEDMHQVYLMTLILIIQN